MGLVCPTYFAAIVFGLAGLDGIYHALVICGSRPLGPNGSMNRTSNIRKHTGM